MSDSLQEAPLHHRGLMPTLWIGNFSFEDELAGKQSTSHHLSRFESELRPLLLAAAATDDLILVSESVDAEYVAHWKNAYDHFPTFVTETDLVRRADTVTAVSPWGWTESIRKRCVQHRISFQAPAQSSILKANSRVTTFQLAKEFGSQVEGECVVKSVEQLRQQLLSAEFANGYVLKSEFGQAGREQMRSRSSELSAQIQQWASSRLQTSRSIVLEPFLNSVQEYGIQWTLSAEKAEPILFGITQLVCDQRGQYLESIVHRTIPDNPLLAEIIEQQRLAAKSIRDIGYFGPLGIDGMIYVNASGDHEARPLQDINARWTMGRLAICWANLCFPDRDLVHWRHGPPPVGVNAIKTSPDRVGNQPVKFQAYCYDAASREAVTD